jgi:WD40-like Beta Propeller Repeat
MTKLVLALVLAALGAFASVATARNLPDGFTVVPASISPDGKLGVIAPDLDHVKEREHQNKLIEIATGKVLAVIDADTAFEHQNHTTLSPTWSDDGSLLVWYSTESGVPTPSSCCASTTAR